MSRLAVVIFMGLRVNRPTESHEGTSIVPRPPPGLKGQGDKGRAGLSIPPPLGSRPVAGTAPISPGAATQSHSVGVKDALDNNVGVEGCLRVDV